MRHPRLHGYLDEHFLNESVDWIPIETIPAKNLAPKNATAFVEYGERLEHRGEGPTDYSFEQDWYCTGMHSTGAEKIRDQCQCFLLVCSFETSFHLECRKWSNRCSTFLVSLRLFRSIVPPPLS